MLARTCDSALHFLKWPLGLCSAALVPGALLACLELLGTMSLSGRWGAVLAGIAAYGTLWLLIFRKRFAGSAFSTLEHEVTHALFALMTFHRVTRIRTSWDDGGVTHFRGRGNWLILLAPYFFPTLTVAVAVGSLFHSGPWLPYAMGATWAYHVTSTWKETHWDQPDLKESGRIFSLVFLPGANLVSMGALLAVAMGGATQAMVFLNSVWRFTLSLYL